MATGRHLIHNNNVNEDSTQVIFADVNGMFCFLVWVYLVCFNKNLPFEWTVFIIQQFHCINDIYPSNYPYFAGIKMQYLPLHTNLWEVQEHQGSWSLRNLYSKTLYPMVQVEELCYMWVYGISIAAISFVLFNSAVKRTCNLVCQTFLKGQACAHLLIGFCWFSVMCNFLNSAARLGKVSYNKILWCLCLLNLHGVINSWLYMYQVKSFPTTTCCQVRKLMPFSKAFSSLIRS